MRNITAAFKLAAANYQSFEDILDKQSATSQYSRQQLRNTIAIWVDDGLDAADNNTDVHVDMIVDTADRCHKALQTQYPQIADVNSLSQSDEHEVSG